MRFARIGKYVAALTALFMPIMVIAQPTKVRGRVIDAVSGNPVKFARVNIDGMSTSISCDDQGQFSFDTREAKDPILTVSADGYASWVTKVNLHNFTNLDVRLQRIGDSPVPFPTDDNEKVKSILASMYANRAKVDPKNYESYKADVFKRMEMDITNAESAVNSLNIKLVNKILRKNFGFMLDYADTSYISGQPYIPISVSETSGRRYHRLGHGGDKEVVFARKITGLDPNELLTSLTANLNLDADIYQSYITAFNIDIPSPISPLGQGLYNYFIVDSTFINGREAWQIRFVPSRVNDSPIFNGEMYIDMEDFALVDFRGRLDKSSNVNWIRGLLVEVSNHKTRDSLWFRKFDRLTVDFALSQSDETKSLTFLGKNETDYYNPDFSPLTQREIAIYANKIRLGKENTGSENYWKAVRPYQLTQRDDGVYSMLNKMETVPLYRLAYSTATDFTLGYWHLGRFGLYPLEKTYSSSKQTGVTIRQGICTTPEFSTNVRYTLNAGYCFGAKSFVGQAKFEYVYHNDPLIKFTAEVRRELTQLGANTSGLAAQQNVFTSIITKPGSERKSFIDEVNVSLETEPRPGVEMTYSIEGRRVWADEFVPMHHIVDDVDLDYIYTTQAHVKARLARGENIARSYFGRRIHQNSKGPVITLDLMGAIKGVGSQFSFLRPEFTMDYRLPFPPLGVSRIIFNSGTIIGTVPYPFLKLHEGNGTYLYDSRSFTCMDFYEFASSSWASLFYEHNFGGFFFSRIPLIRKLKWRELVTVKAAVGTISKRNDGTFGSLSADDYVLSFPEGMSSLKKPYVEAGFGISNIFKVMSVHFDWRLTHREKEVDGQMIPANNLFSITIGARFNF